MQDWQVFGRWWKKHFFHDKIGLAKIVFARIYFHQNKIYHFLFVFG